MEINELGDKWLIAYRFLLEHYRVLDAFRISRFYRPKKLYKYFSFSSNYWKNNIFSGEIYFNSPQNFNDPLDSRWFINYDKLLTSRFKSIGENWKENELNKLGFLDFMIQLYEEDLYYLQDLFQISCFSETPRSHLMWGHYSDKHRGFCIEYDTSLLQKEIQFIMPIVYNDKPYDASLILDLDDKYSALCPALFKSKDWSYEQEWRIFLQTKNKQHGITLSAVNAITGIYLGLHFDLQSDKLIELERWSKNRNITLYKMQRSYCSYDLVSDTFEDIKSNKKIKGFLFN